MKYIVYLTTNIINNKIYIGVHGTNNPDRFDGYIGCGANIRKPSSYNSGKTHLHRAILKYGVKAFKRKTLRCFDNLDDALDLEALLVTEEFVQRIDTYNMTPGGSFPPIFTKKIFEFDLHGNLIKSWKAIKDISNTYNCDKDQIALCIKAKRSFKHHFWAITDTIDVSQYRITLRGEVVQYNKDGQYLNTFQSVQEASLKLDLPRDSIVGAIFGRHLCAGYYFLREGENISDFLYQKQNKINLNHTKIYRYTLNGDFDKEYLSIKEAVEDTPKSSHGNIIRAIKNNRTCGGYKWSYIKTSAITPYTSTELKSVKIAQYDLQHNLIKIWNTVSECKKAFPSCQKVCRKERRSSNGYIFEYIS